jgi:predicted PurR-regulated permease PerM
MSTPRSSPEAATAAPEGAPARDPYLGRVATTVLVVVIAGTALGVFFLAVDIFLAAFGGLLFAVLLRAATRLLVRITPVPERWGYTALLLLLAALLVGGGLLLAPVAQEQVQRSTEQVPRILADLEEWLQQRGWGEWVLQQVRDGGEGAADGALAFLGGIFGALTNWFYYFLTAFFVGLFAAARPELYVRGTANLFPQRHRLRVLKLMDELAHTLRWWLVGQLLAMVLIGVSTGVLLWAFGVPLALPIGVLVGLLGFIPYLGPIIGLLPVAIVAGMEGPELLLYVVAAYTLVQLVEGYVITPLIQHRMVYLPPVFTIVMQIVVGTLLGVLGFVLATPLAAVLLVISRFYREDVLGETGVVAKGHGG